MNPLSSRPFRSASDRKVAWLTFAGLATLTLLVYWPALHGGYLFDDGVYFVNNSDVHVTTLRFGDWVRAALSQAGINPLVRPLSALTFAANYYFSEGNPFWPKLTNVCIHVFNGWLLFLLLRELFALRALVRMNAATHGLAAALVAGAWLLLPINLTAVAYVSQRMEGLATLFVFLGLFWYMRARRLHYSGDGTAAMMWASVALCTALGLTAKEDAALLPLYTACAEFALTGFRDRNGRPSRAALWTHLVLLIVPLVAGLIWLAPRVLHGLSGYRNFTIMQRLLTEPRVLVEYIRWTLLPNLNSLTFYHDDMPVSEGLLAPSTTLLAILALLALLGVALLQRKARPLFCLGILWFFAGHSMTATIVPLELVFEHRNYFPSVGLLLAVASLLALEPGMRLSVAKALIISGFIGLFAFTTFLRAQEWSDPVGLAYSEALKRPNAPRAQYELARTLIIAAGEDINSPLISQATEVLGRNAYLPGSGITPLQALIYINGRAQRPIDPRWWQAIIVKLRDQAPSASDVSAVIFLYHCQMRGDCPAQKQEMFDTFVTALDRSQGNSNLMSAYAEFALQQLGDDELAGRMYREVVSASPNEPIYRANLVRFLIATEQLDAAKAEIAELAKLNRAGSLDATLAKLDTELATAAKAASDPGNPDELPPAASNR